MNNQRRRPSLLTAGLLALIARADPAAIGPAKSTIPVRMKTGETPLQVLAAYDVFVDGVRQCGTCIEADRAQGYVVRYRVGKDGRIVRNGEELLTERIEGVKVEFRTKTF